MFEKIFRCIQIDRDGVFGKCGSVSVNVSAKHINGHDKAASKFLDVTFPLKNLDCKKGSRNYPFCSHVFKDGSIIILEEV